MSEQTQDYERGGAQRSSYGPDEVVDVACTYWGDHDRYLSEAWLTLGAVAHLGAPS